MASPWMLGFAAGGAETSVVLCLGALILFVNVYTDYEAGPVKVIPMPLHLAWDFLAGMILMLSPMVFNFTSVVWLPHVLMGLLQHCWRLPPSSGPGSG